MALHDLKLMLAPLAWSLLRGTVRLADTAPPEPDGPVIYACLHGDILPSLLYVRPRRPVLLVSTSPDGEILIRALGTRDFGFVRGQTGPQGARALVEMRRHLAEGRSIGLAVDGPKGPFGVIQPGVLQLARLASTPIVPLRTQPGAGRILSTWDRTVVPLPLRRVVVEQGPKLRLAADAGPQRIEEAKRDLARFFRVPGESR